MELGMGQPVRGVGLGPLGVGTVGRQFRSQGELVDGGCKVDVGHFQPDAFPHSHLGSCDMRRLGNPARESPTSRAEAAQLVCPRLGSWRQRAWLCCCRDSNRRLFVGRFWERFGDPGWRADNLHKPEPVACGRL